MRKKLCHEKRTVSRDRSCVIRKRWCHKERGGVLKKEKQAMSKYKFMRKNVFRGKIYSLDRDCGKRKRLWHEKEAVSQERGSATRKRLCHKTRGPMIL